MQDYPHFVQLKSIMNYLHPLKKKNQLLGSNASPYLTDERELLGFCPSPNKIAKSLPDKSLSFPSAMTNPLAINFIEENKTLSMELNSSRNEKLIGKVKYLHNKYIRIYV